MNQNQKKVEQNKPEIENKEPVQTTHKDTKIVEKPKDDVKPNEQKKSEEKPVSIPLKESVKLMMTKITAENYLECISKARTFKKEGNMEKCLDMLDAMIKQGINLFQDYDVKLAIPYFRLGDVLLQKMENQNEIFGGGLDKKKGEQNKNALSERDQEIKVGWENLEIARVIVEKFLEKKDLEISEIKEKNLLLADIYKRLGECENLKENFSKAREELAKGIQILERIEDVSSSRLLSENYYLMSRTISYEAKAGHAKEAKLYIEKAIQIISKIKESSEMTEEKKKELEGVLMILKQKKDDLVEEMNATNPGDPKAIKEAISKTNFATSTSFPKAELKGEKKVNKLGTFGKGKERISKKLKEPVSIDEKPKQELSKAVKKVQTPTEA